jgi:prepilin-type N-terminal cleavage/methylation domain-containing protein
MRGRGFSLLEVLFALAAIALLALGVAGGVVTGQQASRTLEDQARLENTAFDFQERLMAIPFGSLSDSPASGAELDELFDDDDVLGTVTLHKLAAFGPAEFTLAGSGLAGQWRIVVDADLNGDGTIDATLEEGRDDLLRIAVFYEGRLLARTARVNIVTVN